MKRVFTKADDVIHLFAQQTQSDARSSNVFFTNTTKLYSYGYHYLLAEFIDDKTVFINDDGYSVTTSKHISSVSYATRQYKQFYKSKSDLQRVYEACKRNADKLAKARKPQLYISEILSLFDSLNEYLTYTKTLTKTKRTKEYKYIAKLVKDINNNPDATQQKLKEAREKELKRIEKRNAKLLKQSLEKFNNYEINSFRIGDEDYLRISKDKTTVQTSQNVSVPIDEARLLYQMIKAGKQIQGFKIGYYTVTSINGTLKIGCHNINMNSVKQVGEVLINN